jgi:hypothetical protein
MLLRESIRPITAGGRIASDRLKDLVASWARRRHRSVARDGVEDCGGFGRNGDRRRKTRTGGIYQPMGTSRPWHEESATRVPLASKLPSEIPTGISGRCGRQCPVASEHGDDILTLERHDAFGPAGLDG